MYCRYCGKELLYDSNFCPNCGKKQKESNVPSLFGRNKFIEVVKTRKKTAYLYSAWFLVNLCLFIFSKPKGSDSGDFYPFSRPLGEIFDGRSFYVNILAVDRYDFSELFFYVIFLPVAIFGLVKCFPYLSLVMSKLKERYNQWQESNAKKREDNQGNIVAYKTPRKEYSIIEPIEVKPVVEEISSPEGEESKEYYKEVTINEGKGSEKDTLLKEEQISDEVAYAESSSEVKKMPLLSRFIGSIIDKILILIIFVVGSIAISPYGAAGRLGTYIGLRNISLNNYEYIDKAAMNRYGTYSDGVSQYYQNMERLSNDPPHIGSTLELDMNITFSFILLNLLFYILFESILSASLGKRMLGGVVLDSADDKIGFGKALKRGLCGGALMAGTYFLLHLQGGLSNTVVVVVFFLILDLPVLFTKRSLLDICTGTTYMKR